MQRRLGELEAVIMDRVWARTDPVTVRDIFDELALERQIAYTTVLSTMDNLYRKKWLTRQRDGKAYEYSPVMSRAQRSAALMREAFTAGGDTDAVLTFFVEQMTSEESDRLKAALRRSGRRR